MEAYQDALDRGDSSAMEDLIRNLVHTRGGEVLDQAQLTELARMHSSGTGASTPTLVVTRFRALQQSLEDADWIRYQEASGSSGAPGEEGQDSSQPPAKKGKSVEEVVVVPDLGGGGEVGGQSHGPPAFPMPSAPFLEGGASSSSSSSTVLPGGFTQVNMSPNNVQEDHKPLFILWNRTWNPLQIWAVGARISYSLVLQDPRNSDEAIRLFEGLSLEEAQALVGPVTNILQAESNQSMSSIDCYLSVYHDQVITGQLRSLFQTLQVVRPSAPPAETTATQGSSSSSSSSSTAPPPQPQHQHQHQHGDGTADDVERPEGPGECPICLNEIHPSDAAMRCNGLGGHHHYFHSNCMQRWISQCRAGRDPNCPVCRGTIQFNAQRLESFLSGRQSENLSSEDRTFLKECAARLRAAGESWGEAINWENAKYVGGILGAGGWGFMIGYMQPPPDLQYHMTLNLMTRQQNIAQSVGWVLGLIARVLREHYKKRQEEEERERRRSGDRRH